LSLNKAFEKKPAPLTSPLPLTTGEPELTRTSTQARLSLHLIYDENRQFFWKETEEGSPNAFLRDLTELHHDAEISEKAKAFDDRLKRHRNKSVVFFAFYKRKDVVQFYDENRFLLCLFSILSIIFCLRSTRIARYFVADHTSSADIIG
jgi:hypothetical protein